MKQTNWAEPQKVTASYAWRRFFARGVDCLFYWYLVNLTLKIINYAFSVNYFYTIKDKLNNNYFIQWVVTTYIWLFVNAFLMHYFGNTLGKKILGIKVLESNNMEPSLIRLIKREFLVLLKGMALGIPIISLIPTFLSYKKLIKFQNTSWDTKMNFKIIYRKQSLLITLIIIFVYIIFFELLNILK
ncbi:RDD family protein [Rickettsia endosymbiont of Polydrusus tereticollis]|uniref:RDD family protein n=1 Tax=Rickettsia endosymbiont of Polydrusus tereticollis TaxID=3066251 RepID=UPI0031333AEE